MNSSSLNPYSIAGKTILVTGASSGIGKATAIECSKLGATLVITARNAERLSDTLAQLSGDAQHTMVAGDLNSEDFRKELVGKLPKLDGVVLAAGIAEFCPVMFATRDKFGKIFETNFFSPMDLLRLIVKKKAYNPSFSAVAIASVAGFEDFTLANGIYGSSKSALASYLKSFAKEVASKNIRVNTISPGMILTPMHTSGAENGNVAAERLDEAVSAIPFKRWGKPEDIAYAAIYLLSDAAAYLTGSDIKVDGGYTLV